jgi:hypothetical protein
MNKEYSDYIIIPAYSDLETIHENFSIYNTDDINIFTDMTISEIVNIILKLSIINASTLLANISSVNENIQRVSLVLLYLPITSVYSIISTMIIISSQINISIIVSILLNLPISAVASIIENINIPLDIIFPVNTNRYIIINLIKSEIISNMPIHKAAVILSESNMSISQINLILSHIQPDKASLILSKINIKHYNL